jgi:hypothetical protein
MMVLTSVPGRNLAQHHPDCLLFLAALHSCTLTLALLSLAIAFALALDHRTS